ncbi:hypothetical protein SRABI106_00385 [Rahnella aquatilis]|nr:hypothetical protein SRABI106_00385 [Rahnella aquatilis]
MVTNNVDLLNFGRNTFGEDQLQINTVTWQRGHNRFYRCTVFTDAVIEVFETFLDAADGCTVKGFANTDARGLQVLLQHVIFHRFVTGESNAGNSWTFFDLNNQRISIAQDTNILEVASGKQCTNGITDIIVSHRITDANRHIE